jgi:hypothetical protein
MEIRKIHPGEIDGLLNLIHQYAEEASENMPMISGEISERVILENIRSWSIQHTHCLFVGYSGDRPIGFVAGFVIQMPWSVAPQANLNFIFMTEEYRSMENFKALLDTFEGWAKALKAKRLIAGDMGINLERSRKLYSYLGFREALLSIREIEE